MVKHNQISNSSRQSYLWRSPLPLNPQTSTPPVKLKTLGLLVWVTGDTVFTVNANSIEEIFIPDTDQTVSFKKQRFLLWRQQMIPAYHLVELLNQGNSLLEETSQEVLSDIPDLKKDPEPMLVLSQGRQVFALEPEIESFVTASELVIQPFIGELGLPSYIYGCTSWKDRLLQVIDVAVLFNQTMAQRQRPTATVDGTTGTSNKTTLTIPKVKKPTVLVVDDSNSVREILSLTLRTAGYQVLQAKDGQEAITQLKQNSTIQLVICDVEMPNVNGFEFLSYRFKDPQLVEVPVVMLSTCNSDQHRQLAMQLGATSYFTKPYIEQEFLAALKVILSENS
jgi:CheY-like chemotaxis protein